MCEGAVYGTGVTVSGYTVLISSAVGGLRMRLRARLRFVRLRMRWQPQRGRTVRILRVSECKRGCVFLQFLQETGFS
jgi:hypothetical protein